mmetsp:Transcript_16112/g.54156  ORF Transcript_16112/g.54156 Transcript_16112/m.54156 type:complete len:208 (-) Transcript_16112:420-1043(-)|eukprot:CAMPEP_0205999490 /NCGR_PEP_ID=MMETSP1464-20131121/883_1 /ASSEMBLY_ACC=CAM_ASM_001124 /TAXON_ID=119497 /ORGANISM="Exanthemachrysis gayraliae, Strain RCC1523" /LENGTH=207 /DNA_ID=CAMNT_0053372693 /DNA_START=24 /DNA_END=647 /DNA_ORIENTATION=-
MAAAVDDIRIQHRVACDKIIERLETKSSRGEGPSRVLRKILKHFDTSDGKLMLTHHQFLSAMERIGTKLSQSDVELLLALYNIEGGGVDGQRFAEDLFGEGGRASATIVDSGIEGGIFTNSAATTPRDSLTDAAAQYRLAGPIPSDFVPPDPALQPPAGMTQKQRRSNDPSVPGGIFGATMLDDTPREPNKRVSKTNLSSIPGGIFG